MRGQARRSAPASRETSARRISKENLQYNIARAGLHEKHEETAELTSVASEAMQSHVTVKVYIRLY